MNVMFAPSRELVALCARAKRKRFIVHFLTYTVCCLFLVCAAYAAEGPIRFDIPRQRADDALTAFGRQADISVVYPYDVVGRYTANRLTGTYGVREAIDILLKDSGLKADFDESGHLVIFAEPDTDKEKKVTRRGSGKTFLAKLLAGVSTAVVGAGGAYAQDDDVDQIIVVGSSIGVSIEEAESQALPIDVLGADQLEGIGQFTVGDILRNQPAFSGGNGQNVGDGETQSFVNLRGVGPQYTLTLIDGKRFSVNGPGNVTMIPPAALERVEVLKAGASSIYGSDAVAGVVNFVLKDNQDGVGLNARYGSADGWEFQNYTFSFGGGDDQSSFFFLADYYTNPELSGFDRFDLISNDRRSLGGRDFRSTFQNPGRVTLGDGSNVILDYNRFGPGQGSQNPADYRPFDFENDRHDRADPCRDGGAVCRGNQAFAPTDRYSVVFNGKHEFSDRTTMRANFMFHRIDTTEISGVSTFNVDVPAGNFWNPFGEEVRVAFRPFGGGELNNVGGVNDQRLDALRGAVTVDHELSDRFMLSVSGNAFHQNIEDNRPNIYISDAVVNSLALDGPESINVFCNRCNTSEQYAGILHNRRRNDISDLYTFDARVNGSAFSLPGGDVEIVAGMNWRREEFEIRPDPLFAAGALEDSSSPQPQELSRSVLAGFAEARIPILAPAAGSSEPRVELGVALRYEDFSDVGGTFDPLVSARAFIIPDELLVRASWNTSFRAPQLEDLAGAQDFAELNLIDPLNPQLDSVDVQGITGGNPDLEPEDAETISVGVVYTPEAVPGLFISADWWRLEQSNVILAPDPQAVLSGIVPGNVLRGTGIGSGGENIIVEAFLINVANREIEGIDFAINYAAPITDSIDGRINFGGTYTRKFDAEIGNGDGFQELGGTANLVFGALPQLRLVSQAALETGPVTGLVEFTYISGYDDTLVEDFRVDSTLYVDLQGTYRFDEGLGPFKNAALTLGVENVGDVQPPFIPRFNFFSQSLNDIRGRWWYASLGVNF